MRAIFKAAEAHGLALDFHVDEGLADGLDGLGMIADLVIETGFEGPVLCGHCCSLMNVEGDALDVIGSGIGAGPASDGVAFEARIIASNAIAREAIAAATDLPLTVNDETLYDNVTTLAPRIADHIRAMPKGLLLLGGEPTVLLPDTPGKGGRNMALAALLARELAGVEGVEILVAGTDGTDGPTDAAGAIVDGSTWKSTGAAALERADIYPWLKDQGALFVSGPTGTNVMDILLARKS